MEMTKPAVLWKAAVLVILCWHGALSFTCPGNPARPSESEGPTATALRRRSFSLAPCSGLQIGIHIRGKRTAGEPWLSEAYDEYEKRLRPVLTLETHWYKTDSEMLAAIARGKAPLICLDEKGAQYTSESFAELVYKKLEEGGSRMAFVIGGAEGLPRELKTRKDLLSLGRMTFPHQLARVLLAEQVYRATEIRKGSGYHKA